MHFSVQFCIETIDGDRLGKLSVPHAHIADWLNFLVSPQYQAEIIAAEQNREGLSIYFKASEGLYLYLDMRLNQEPLAIAG